jgi:hypothetical protein
VGVGLSDLAGAVGGLKLEGRSRVPPYISILPPR